MNEDDFDEKFSVNYKVEELEDNVVYLNLKPVDIDNNLRAAIAGIQQLISLDFLERELEMMARITKLELDALE